MCFEVTKQASFCSQHQLNNPKINDMITINQNYSGQFSVHRHSHLMTVELRLHHNNTIDKT